MEMIQDVRMDRYFALIRVVIQIAPIVKSTLVLEIG
jgi:hypothetical protein